ncbi:hypothetical protein HY449_00565 [Candidatus Pacearchaeota archaeon]|nr:hypothetical protein [Candidatus Pacearchaeota archaeon]
MGLYALNNPERKVPCVEGIVSDSSIGTRPVHTDGFGHEDRECTRTHLLNSDECFVFGSPIEMRKGEKVMFYEHDRGEAGIIVELAGIEFLSRDKNVRERKCIRGYGFRD